MPATEPKSDVIYRSGTNEALGAGWDVMQVVYRREDSGQMRIRNSFVIARDLSGKIIQKTDIILDRWEVINDEEMLRGFQHGFQERDRIMAERAKSFCKCGHGFTLHTRRVGQASTMRVDDALLPQKRYDIFSDKPAGESGCTECSCSRWVPANY